VNPIAKPVLQALVVADHVYTDNPSGKKIIAGTFSGFQFGKLPPLPEKKLADGTTQKALVGGVQPSSPYAYISLTDVCDGTKLLLQFVNLTKNVVLFETGLTVNCNDRLKTIEIIAPLPFLPMREAGLYALELVWEGEIIGSWRIASREVNITLQ
jgi:hypothetical protein